MSLFLFNLGVVLHPSWLIVLFGGKLKISACVLINIWVLLCIEMVDTVHVLGAGLCLGEVVCCPLATKFQKSHSDPVECCD